MKPTYFGSLRGILESTEDPLGDEQNDAPSTLTIPLGNGTVSGEALFGSIDIDADFKAGGDIPIQANFRLRGNVVPGGPFQIDDPDAGDIKPQGWSANL